MKVSGPGQPGREAGGGEVRRYVLMFFTALATLMVAGPVFAQETATKASSMDTATWVAITSGFAMAIASAACGYAQSKATAAACEGLARNPGARPGIQFALILALVLIESMALYTFAVIFAKVVVP
jgi:F-type H+-transporting ATPase subunit c